MKAYPNIDFKFHRDMWTQKKWKKRQYNLVLNFFSTKQNMYMYKLPFERCTI